MAGGLMQLVAYGAQDVFLTGNPQVTFFKVVYKRHTNFSAESIRQTFNGAADFGRKVSCTISRNGDMIHRMYLQVTLPALADGERWTHRVGLALIKSVELEIGGQTIDRQYGEWFNIWNELSLSLDKRQGWQRMVGQEIMGVDSSYDNGWNSSNGAPKTTLYIPLEFWFCRNAGLALPLISLQYHEVKVNVEFRNLSELDRFDRRIEGSYSLVDAALWCDYIYLDTDERRRFAQASHEYLIEQLQVIEQSVRPNSSASRVDLTFNHPVKELIWVVQLDGVVDGSDNSLFDYNQESGPLRNLWFNYTDGFEDQYYRHNNITLYSDDFSRLNNCTSAKLQLNGHDRFQERAGDYFNLVQPFQHHTCTPLSRGINVYSFALRPEEHQPSGTCNFSRIDNALLIVGHDRLGNKTAKVRVYALNYNVLRVMSGMAGLAYSN
jgi:hypothetical protein